MSNPLCSAADVRRMLHDDTLPDDALEAWIETASDWVVNITQQDWTAAGAVVEHFYNRRQDDILFLKDKHATVTGVAAFFEPGSEADALVENVDFLVQVGGKVQLLYQQFSFPEGLEGAVVSILPKAYSQVDVAYTGVNLIPASVRDGTALIAGALYSQSERIANGLESERMGDYSYTVDLSKDQIPKLARQLLRVNLQRHRVRSA